MKMKRTILFEQKSINVSYAEKPKKIAPNQTKNNGRVRLRQKPVILCAIDNIEVN